MLQKPSNVVLSYFLALFFLLLSNSLYINFICHVNIYISIGMLGENVSTQLTYLIVFLFRFHQQRLPFAPGFVMVRKILEVKEVQRIAEEACLSRVMKKSSDDPLPPHLD